MVLRRIRNMVVATVNDNLDKMENPLVMINQYLRDMEEELSKARHAVAQQEAIKADFERRLTYSQKMKKKRYDQAQIAVNSGEEDLARKALMEMKQYEEKVLQYEEIYEQSVAQLVELKEQLGKLEERIQALRDKRHTLVARANVVKAKEHMNASINRIDSNSSYREFQRLEARIMDMETKANVYTSYNFGGEQTSFTKLEHEEDVENELQKLKEVQKA
ncbi:PspA/IM30 family protein [Priestia filamentosa]|uniref:Protein LiaH n=1 Tax=Priestia filamentosa TaxID=1402861 RepID=A0A1X7FPR7_9BACI|nr:PspA/IM30 family protein [Priestia filamentosa]AKO94616.1 protein LiaH [Priestia filamentosa]MDT3764924.1 PspA/IM30 family protein [Priestia filamentosa]OXS66640.1 protein LiaH [Priestia filamentosa]WCM15518.1 PspA/IM30 family protein [Priestia filamentosa]WRU95245.1 PspA/IM30 family protein [Priestia filamentosa]